jgi:hypothetical protein
MQTNYVQNMIFSLHLPSQAQLNHICKEAKTLQATKHALSESGLDVMQSDFY